MKILAVASAGGHWNQLLRLMPSFEDNDVTFVCTDRSKTIDVSVHKFYAIGDANRNSKLALMIAGIHLAAIIFLVRPDVVITTGAAPGALAIALSKMLCRARTIWVDSVANSEEPSLAGIKIRRLADLWLTQSMYVAEKFGMRYEGEVI